MPEKDDEEGFGVNLNNYIKLDGMQARWRRGNLDKGKKEGDGRVEENVRKSDSADRGTG